MLFNKELTKRQLKRTYEFHVEGLRCAHLQLMIVHQVRFSLNSDERLVNDPISYYVSRFYLFSFPYIAAQGCGLISLLNYLNSRLYSLALVSLGGAVDRFLNATISTVDRCAW